MNLRTDIRDADIIVLHSNSSFLEKLEMAGVPSDILRDIIDGERLIKKLNEADAKKHKHEIHAYISRFDMSAIYRICFILFIILPS